MNVDMSTSSSAERARRSSDVDRPSRAAQSNPHVARTSGMPCSRSASSKRRVTAARACCGSVIVGGGGHGLATAYYLAKKHNMKNIAVLEKGWIGGGNTGRNTNPH